MCRSSSEGGRRCRGFSSTRAGERLRKQMGRARRAMATAEAAGDIDGETRASQKLFDAQLAFTYAQADHDLACSDEPLAVADRYRVMANAQRGGRRASPAQVEAMRDYVAVSDRFNHCLRNPERLAADHHTRAQIQQIRRVLARSTVAEDLVVYRVTPADAPPRDPAFLSTTLDLDFARDYQRQMAGRATRIEKIHVPAGAPALFINNTFEREVVLDGTVDYQRETIH